MSRNCSRILNRRNIIKHTHTYINIFALPNTFKPNDIHHFTLFSVSCLVNIIVWIHFFFIKNKTLILIYIFNMQLYICNGIQYYIGIQYAWYTLQFAYTIVNDIFL